MRKRFKYDTPTGEILREILQQNNSTVHLRHPINVKEHLEILQTSLATIYNGLFGPGGAKNCEIGRTCHLTDVVLISEGKTWMYCGVVNWLPISTAAVITKPKIGRRTKPSAN